MYLNLPMQEQQMATFLSNKGFRLRLIRREILLWDTDVFLYSVVAVGRQSYAGIPVISGLPSIIWVLIFMDVIWHTEVCSCLLLLRGYSDTRLPQADGKRRGSTGIVFRSYLYSFAFDDLQAKIYNVDTYSGMEEMLPDEAFAGGLSQQHMNGNFGMKLHEHDKYNGSHRARKSFHFFDETISMPRFGYREYKQ